MGRPQGSTDHRGSHGGNNNPKGNNQFTKGRVLHRAEVQDPHNPGRRMPGGQTDTEPQRETPDTEGESEVGERGEERRDAERE